MGSRHRTTDVQHESSCWDICSLFPTSLGFAENENITTCLVLMYSCISIVLMFLSSKPRRADRSEVGYAVVFYMPCILVSLSY